MCNKQNLKHRVNKAKATLSFISVCQRNVKGQPVAFYVPGSQAKLYHVILKRDGGSLVSELHVVVGENIVKTHFGYHTLTYHSMAAVMFAARESGYRVQWCSCERDATNITNLGGAKFRLRNFDNDANEMWGVYFNDR